MWRKVRKEDVRCGLMIRIGNISDTAYNGATVIAITEAGYVRVARPMAYASADFNMRQPDLHCEVYEMNVERMCAQDTDVEVYEDRDGVARMMAHRSV